MDFDKIYELASHIPDKIEKVQSEDAAKMAFVQPFMSALGYDLHDPAEVVPEYSIDLGGRRNENVDYAIFKDSEPIALIECKWCGKCGADLNKEHYSQLKKYYNLSPAKFGILTNGIIYKFYSDLDEPNKMDKMPFLELNLLNIKEPIINDPILAEIKNFSKPIDKDAAYERAQALKYMREIRDLLESEFKNPSDDFVKFFASRILNGEKRMRKGVVDQFKEYTTKTCDKFIQDKIDDFIKYAKNAAKGGALSPENPTLDVNTGDSLPDEIKYFIFNDKKYELELWKDMLPKVCAIMASRHKDQFEKVLTIKGHKYIYFSKNPEEFKYGEQIEGTNIYVNTNYGPWDQLNRSRKVVALFGYSKDDIQIER